MAYWGGNYRYSRSVVWMGGYLHCVLCGHMEKTKNKTKRICAECYEEYNPEYGRGAVNFVLDEEIQRKSNRVAEVAQELRIEKLRRSEEDK